MVFHSIKKFVPVTILVVFLVLILSLSLRGIPGNPDEKSLNSSVWAGTSAVPFGSSNDQGRFSLTYAFVENHTVKFSSMLAKFSAPDLAINDQGEYVSLFAPGVSFLVMPGYILGKYLGSSQVGTFSVVAIMAVINGVLMFALAKRLGASSVASGIGVLSFLFATPAFAYAVSLSQHHFSVFCLLMSVYLLLRFTNWWSLTLVWFLCALSVVIDNPNVFMMFPIGVYALGRIVLMKQSEQGVQVRIRSVYVLTFLSMLVPLFFFGWFNLASNGSLSKLSGTLVRVISVSAPSFGSNIQNEDIDRLKAPVIEDQPGKEKNVVNFFKTRNLLNGLYIHLFSPDRGILYFAPVVFLGILGFFSLFRKNKGIAMVMIASIGANVLLYSMWGDPWGGWAFGSRYLIPSYAFLCLGVASLLSEWARASWILAGFFIIFSYSVAVNTLGALGTSSLPPQVEISALEKITGKHEKFDFTRSSDFLKEKGSRALVYKVVGNRYVSAMQYFAIVSGSIVFVGGILLILLRFKGRKMRI